MSNTGRPYTTPENGLTSKGDTHQPFIAQASEDHGHMQMVTNRSVPQSIHGAVPTTHNAQWQQPAATIQLRPSPASNSQLHQLNAGTIGSTGVRPASSTPPSAAHISIEPSLDHLRQERERLLTFGDDWLSNFHVTPKDLAAAGLYRFGVGDMVRCIFCKGSLKQWEPGDHPMEEHRKFFPQCPFVQGLEVGNIKMPVTTAQSQSFPIEYRQDILTSRDTPLYIHYKDFDCRVRSFGSRHLPPKQSAVEMANSGFYYVGPHDTVMCFWCGGSLKNWVEKDRPLSEHIRWFPHCQFAQKLSTPASATFHAGGSNIAAVSHNTQPQLSATNQEPSSSQHSSFISNNLPLMIQSMTVDDEEEKQSPMDVLENGEDARSSKSDPHLLEPGYRVPGHSANSNSQTSSILSSDDIVEENRRLKSVVECKICMANDVNTLFLPCGHLVCCNVCAMSCSQCPVCRAEVRGTIRTFM